MGVQKHNDKIILSLENSSVEVYLFGGTIVSWKSRARKEEELAEHLFVSSKSARDGSKPIRGGIPIVFPFFGNPPSETEQPDFKKVTSSHGFARTEIWSYDESATRESEENVSVRLALKPSSHVQSIFPKSFELDYVIELSQAQLSTSLHVKNTSSASDLTFQALLHNYFHVSTSQSVLITPLKGLTYTDKVDGFKEKVEDRENGVDVKKFTDSVYHDARRGEDVGLYHARWSTGGMDLRVEGFDDVVVWNPQEEAGKKIGDMEDGGWERYVCVEPGTVSHWLKLSGGESWVGKQVLTPVSTGSHL